MLYWFVDGVFDEVDGPILVPLVVVFFGVGRVRGHICQVSLDDELFKLL